MEKRATLQNFYYRHSRSLQGLLPLIGLLLITVLFTVVSEGVIFNSDNIRTLINQLFPIMLISLGAQFILAHGSLDLTIGASLGVSMMIGSIIIRETGSVPVAATAIIMTAVLISFINGGISSYLRLPALLVSLVIMFILRGILQYVSSIEIIKIDGIYGRFDNYLYKAIVLLALIGFTFYLFQYTKLGKYNKIIGGNPVAAELLGIPVSWYKMKAYLLTGLLVGIAAFFAMCRERYISADTGSGKEFDIMVALIFGGMPLSGGSRARFSNALVGALIFTILSNGMILWGLNTGEVALIRGIIFLIIVYLGYKKEKGPLPR